MDREQSDDRLIIPMAFDSRPPWLRYLPLCSLTSSIAFSITWIFSDLVWAASLATLALCLVYLALDYFDRSDCVEFLIEKDALVARGDPWLSDSFPLRSLDLSHALIVDLTLRGPQDLKWKTLGAGLPGYHAGHYTLRNHELAYVFVSDKRRVVYLPRTTDDRSLLLSVPDPVAFLALLEKAVRSLS